MLGLWLGAQFVEVGKVLLYCGDGIAPDGDGDGHEPRALLGDSLQLLHCHIRDLEGLYVQRFAAGGTCGEMMGVLSCRPSRLIYFLSENLLSSFGRGKMQFHSCAANGSVVLH